ncbi:MAG: M14 family metallopeptidase [Hydrogenophaga sp.]|nr:M14 family metallopeptidase [Hydrogenophaga sp.]
MISPQAAFSSSYASARIKFLEGAAAAGMAISSHSHPLPGRDGETLAMDVALDGSPDAERLLVVSSACHGVEGYCGSGVQVFATHDAEWREHARSAGVAVLYIHALNPHGFSWVRRVTNENVDLNRNFQDFSQPLPGNAAYAEIHHLLLPDQWPPGAENQAAIDAYIQTHGLQRYQAAVSQGQHSHADGLFFGGTAPTWSNLTLRQVLRRHGQAAQHLAWIDLHTGLGASGVGERICACRDDKVALARARAWWGGDGKTPVTSIYDGSSTSALLTGLMWSAAYEECPKAEYTGIAMEYGTVPITEVIDALRADHWLHLHPEAPPELRTAIKQRILAAFYTDTDEWKAQIVTQARQSMFQAIDGLAAQPSSATRAEAT